MSNATRWLLRAVLAVFVIAAAFHIVTHAIAVREAAIDPAHAEAARQRLTVEPLDGTAFGVIASQTDDPVRALELHRIAVRHAPRDTSLRVLLINRLLRDGRHVEALPHVDTLLRIAPVYREQVYPVIAQLAGDAQFADALLRTLHTNPTWRLAFIEQLMTADHQHLLDALHARGEMTSDEFNRWLEGLFRRSRWGDAYGLWATRGAPGSAPQRWVNNGDFRDAPGGAGFDWRVVHVPGVELDFVHVIGANGLVAHARFQGRPVAQVGLEQPLVLVPGSYRLTARMRAESLAGETGLQWIVACDGVVMQSHSPPVLGSLGWKSVFADFDVPATGCPGQWLRLVNTAPAGAAQQLSGDLWLDDIVIHRRDAAPVASAMLRVSAGIALRSGEAGFTEARTGDRLAEGDQLVVTAGTVATLTHPNGCAKTYRRRGVYPVAQAACADLGIADLELANTGTNDARAVRLPALPLIEVRPDNAQERLPIGR
ncbi:MAG: hypothetical protein M3R16_00570 [Pseudomonadota bacterium]|nr:hypothetical protein [Pseudomonadota bacterium]